MIDLALTVAAFLFLVTIGGLATIFVLGIIAMLFESSSTSDSSHSDVPELSEEERELLKNEFEYKNN